MSPVFRPTAMKCSNEENNDDVNISDKSQKNDTDIKSSLQKASNDGRLNKDADICLPAVHNARGCSHGCFRAHTYLR